jgi:acyl dehydratase
MSSGLTLKTATNTIGEGYTFDGPSRTITDAHFLFFTGLTGDMGRSHIDAHYAKRTSLGAPSAHGLLINAFTALGASNLRDKPEGFIFIEQGCKFLKPAVSGDTLTPKFEIEKIWQEGHRTFCRIKTRVTNQREETVIEGFHLYRIIPPKPEQPVA